MTQETREPDKFLRQIKRIERCGQCDVNNFLDRGWVLLNLLNESIGFSQSRDETQTYIVGWPNETPPDCPAKYDVLDSFND